MATLTGGRQAAHGALFLLVFALTMLSPAGGRWPFFWLVPLAAYLTLVAILPPLRRTFAAPRIGRVTTLACVFTGAIILVSCATLVLYQQLVRPDVSALAALLPIQALGGVMLAGPLFALLNATLEELIFRGILFDAIASDWGWRMAVAATALLFGVGHLKGYPPGWPGAVQAGIYGIMLSLLRVQTGGLLFADHRPYRGRRDDFRHPGQLQRSIAGLLPLRGQQNHFVAHLESQAEGLDEFG